MHNTCNCKYQFTHNCEYFDYSKNNGKNKYMAIDAKKIIKELNEEGPANYTVSIDKKVMEEFREICDSNKPKKIKISHALEKLMRDFIDSVRKQR